MYAPDAAYKEAAYGSIPGVQPPTLLYTNPMIFPGSLKSQF